MTSITNLLQENNTLALTAAELTQKILNPYPTIYTFDKQTYHHKRFTEKFIDEQTDTEITIHEIAKRHFPDYKSYSTKMTPPDDFYLFAPSIRYRIQKAVQLQHQPPPITPLSQQFTNIFNLICIKATDHWNIQQQFSTSMWAADQDEDLATALLLYYGYSTRYQSYKMAGSANLTVVKNPTNITIDISYPHTFQERLKQALVTIQQKQIIFPNITQEQLTSEGIRIFRSYQGRLLSIPAQYHLYVASLIRDYIGELQSFTTTKPPIPDLEPPDNLLSPRVITLPYSSFKFEQDTAANIARRQNAQIHQTDALFKNIQAASIDINTPFKRSVISPYINDQQLKRAVDNGYLSKPKYGYYQLTEKFKEAYNGFTLQTSIET